MFWCWRTSGCAYQLIPKNAMLLLYESLDANPRHPSHGHAAVGAPAMANTSRRRQVLRNHPRPICGRREVFTPAPEDAKQAGIRKKASYEADGQ